MARRLIAAIAALALVVIAASAAADPATRRLTRLPASLGAAGVPAPPDTPPICLIGCGNPNASRTSIVCRPATRAHYEAIYVTPPDGIDRSADLVDLFRRAIYKASAYLDATARAEGGRARYPMLCDQRGVPVVHILTLPPQLSALPSFDQIVGALEGRFHSRLAKYFVYYDGCEAAIGWYCPAGQSTWHIDDRPGASNANNFGPTFSIVYGGQTAEEGPDWYTLLHESTHGLGAVQLSAPHSDGGSHCTDYADTMCGVINVAAVESGQLTPTCGSPLQIETAEYAYDCNADDYFNVHPRPGSYLATHWNIAAPYVQFIVHD